VHRGGRSASQAPHSAASVRFRNPDLTNHKGQALASIIDSSSNLGQLKAAPLVVLFLIFKVDGEIDEAVPNNRSMG
jgi:hypothetical protein